MMRVLYLSHTGMTEPLGQSQVLPYLTGVRRLGVEVEIISFEPAGTRKETVETVTARLLRDDIAWQPLVRSASHALLRKTWEASLALARALTAAWRRRPNVVHARSYLPAAVADAVAMLCPGAEMLFDCRGMLGDEYVDSGHWSRDMFSYRLVKRVERRLFDRARGLVVLTEALRHWLGEHGLVGGNTAVEVIPCCVDTDRFRPDAAARARVRRELGLDGRLAVTYSGTLGSWYLEREMVSFVAALKRQRRGVKFVVLTRAPTERLRELAAAAGLADDELAIQAATPDAMPSLLSAGDLGLSFIAPCFSKMGSSPTKVAEYLAAGMPTVVNLGVGDQAELTAERDACVTLGAFDEPTLAAAAERALAIVERPWETRSAATHAVAAARFGLSQIGVPRYFRLYRNMSA